MSHEDWEDIIEMTDFEIYLVDLSIEELNALAEDSVFLSGKADAYGCDLETAQVSVGQSIISYHETQAEFDALDEWDGLRYA